MLWLDPALSAGFFIKMFKLLFWSRTSAVTQLRTSLAGDLFDTLGYDIGQVGHEQFAGEPVAPSPF